MADDFWSNDDVVPPTPGRGMDFPTNDYPASPAGYRSATPDQESFYHLRRDDNCAGTASPAGYRSVTPDQESIQHLLRVDNCAETASPAGNRSANPDQESFHQDDNCAGTASPAGYRSATADQESFQHLHRDDNCADTSSPAGYRYASPHQERFQHLHRDDNYAGNAVRYTLQDTDSSSEWFEQHIQNETSFSPGHDNSAGPMGNHTFRNTDPSEESNKRYLQSEESHFRRGVDSNFSGTEHVGRWNRCSPDGGVQSHFFRAKYDKNFNGTREGKRFDGRRAARRGRILAKRATGCGARMSGSGRMAARDMLAKRATGFGGHQLGRELPPGFERPLGPNASCTVYVDGLPHDITEREVAHIFRPFDGYRCLRLFTKDNDRPQGADSVRLCFVDFSDAACARKAMDLLRGYKVDLKNPDAPGLRLKFARDTRRKVGTRQGPYNGPWCKGRERSWE